MPGWHEATLGWQQAADIQMVGIIEEQHPDRAALFMQWKQMGWPILVDSLDLLETTVVPQTLAIDEHGVIREVQPRRDDLDGLRARFVDVEFAPPGASTVDAAVGSDHSRPLGAEAVAEGRDERGARASEHESSRTLQARAVTQFLRAGEPDLDAVVAAFEEAVAADPQHAYTLFRTGVAYRRRYDSPLAKPGDFRRAVDYWERALEIDPNNYIWRRRIQQYGPRLDKPYPFYDWVRVAREQIVSRGETPAPLRVEPGGAEFAEPLRAFVGASEPADLPAIDSRILRDDGMFVSVETTVVPSRITAGGSVRAHITFTPNDAIEAHWNNEVDDLVFRLDPPAGWQADRTELTIPNPPETVSREVRKIELELRAPDQIEPGTHSLSGYALYYVCEDVNGICLYRRQDVELVVEVAS